MMSDPALQPTVHELDVCLRAPVTVLSARDGAVRGQGAEGVFCGDVRALSLVEVTVVRRDGTEAHLTRKEHDVLTVLAEHPGRVVTHQRILDAAWPHEVEPRIEYLRIVVRHLRQKLEGADGVGTVIANELGVCLLIKAVYKCESATVGGPAR